MELRKYKRIINKQYPKFDIGKPQWLGNYGLLPNYTDYFNSIDPYQYTSNRYNQDWKNQQIRNTNNENKTAGTLQAIQAGVGLAGNIIDQTKAPSTQEIINQTGNSDSSVMGIGYNKINNVDSQGLLKEQSGKAVGGVLSGAASGASIGSVAGLPGAVIGGAVGGIGSAIGSLFGRKKLKRRLAAAQEKIVNKNAFNRSGAMTEGLNNQYLQQYGDTEDQTLYGFYKGKDSVETADGPTDNVQNSWVSQGEGIWNPSTGAANYIAHGPNDTAKANLKDEDVVFGNEINPESGIKFKDEAAPYILAKEQLNKKKPNSTGWLSDATKKLYEQESSKIAQPIDEKLQDLADKQKFVHQQKNIMERYKFDLGKNSKDNKDYYWHIPGYTDAIPALLGTGASIAQYFDARKQKIAKPNTNKENKYEKQALSTLAKLRLNGYPIAQAIREQSRQLNYALNNSGGLSGAQKYLGRVANENNVYSNISKMWQALQEGNNALSSQYATTAANIGAQDAQRAQAAAQYDFDMYSKAHGARQQGMQTGLYNFLNNINQYAQNEYKRRTGNNMYDLYIQRLNNEKAAILGQLGKPNVNDTTFTEPQKQTAGSIYNTNSNNTKVVYDDFPYVWDWNANPNYTYNNTKQTNPYDWNNYKLTPWR